jgi:excinuclease ABC subunit C
MKKTDELLEKANTLPQEAGCYLMKDKNGRVIYVGKAKKLKSRVTTYFNKSVKGYKTEYMVGHVDDFDFIITHSDAESFILENNLIKEHSPKYNIRLRDDKSYPFLQVNWNEPFPRLEREGALRAISAGI